MELDQIMETYGFETSTSCSGFEWYIKGILYEDNDAFVTVTADDELHLPESMNEPVVVSITDRSSGNELKPSQRFESLRSYLDTLDS
jgi:hypothetical protein